ncbi:MAG: hypothetical protein WCQ82_07110 [Bacteroidaceae bacterium]
MRKVIFLLIFLVAVAGDLLACTSAVISGQVTKDGRPLLWKNRDTGFPQNSVASFQGERYNFIGVVNSVAVHPKEIWVGTNEMGFSIMNTQSYNLEEAVNGEERGPANGFIMYRALSICKDVADFKQFLDTLARPTGLEANIGVIDANGAAMMFEVSNTSYTVYDANNPKDAPFGYVARTNFSFSGKVNKGAGYVRYQQEEKLLQPASAMQVITPRWIMCNLSRSFANPFLGIDLKKIDWHNTSSTGWFVDQDFIPRHSTACSVVIEGVKKGEPAVLTTMWTALGYVPTSVMVPVWVKYAEEMPALLVKNKQTKVAPLCNQSLKLRDLVFSYQQGMGTNRYFHWSLLFNASKTGYIQLLDPVEEEVTDWGNKQLALWREKGTIERSELKHLYQQINSYVTAKYDTIVTP